MKLTQASIKPATILIVDDTPANLRVLTEMLIRRGYTPRPVPSGRHALQAIKIEPPDLILMDINMPDLDGYEVCQAIKATDRYKEIPIIFISSLNETFDKVRAFSVGGIDYITKPFQIDEVYARIETHLKVRQLQLELEMTIQHLEERVQKQVKEISESQIATIFALAKLAESRDDETGKHLERVRSFCRILAAWLQSCSSYESQISNAFIDNIYQASPLHDIGKVGVPDQILLKPGKLTTEEFEIMKKHTKTGAQTLEAVDKQYPANSMISMGIEIARSHHEWWDGSGYPDGLVGEAIPLSARIMSVADVFDALRSKRSYKPALGQEETNAMILNGSGTHHDPQVVKAFFAINDDLNKTFEVLHDENEKSKGDRS